MNKSISTGSLYNKHNKDNISSYSKGSSKQNQSEVVIDIHVKHLKLKVDQKTGLRVVWSRGKKQAKTQVKILNQSLDKAVFDEKFQINTILEFDPMTNMPAKEKISKMTVCLDKSMGGTDIAEINFNMADFKFNEYKILRLYLHKSPDNEKIDIVDDECYLDIGLKGTIAKGFQNISRGASKSSYGGSAYKTASNLNQSTNSMSQSNYANPESRDIQQQLMNEIDKLTKEQRQMKKDQARQTAEKNTKINNLLTDLENTKTDLDYSNNAKNKSQQQKQELEGDMKNIQATFRDQIQEYESVKTNMMRKLNDSLLKDVKIKQLEMENERLKSQSTPNGDDSEKAEKKLLDLYSFDRFNTNYINDVAVFLLKDKKVDDHYSKNSIIKK